MGHGHRFQNSGSSKDDWGKHARDSYQCQHRPPLAISAKGLHNQASAVWFFFICYIGKHVSPTVLETRLNGSLSYTYV